MRNIIFFTVASCGFLKSPTNGRVIYTESKVGSIAVYACDENYVLNGSNVNECVQDGLWKMTIPTCSEFN